MPGGKKRPLTPPSPPPNTLQGPEFRNEQQKLRHDQIERAAKRKKGRADACALARASRQAGLLADPQPIAAASPRVTRRMAGTHAADSTAGPERKVEDGQTEVERADAESGGAEAERRAEGESEVGEERMEGGKESGEAKAAGDTREESETEEAKDVGASTQSKKEKAAKSEETKKKEKAQKARFKQSENYQRWKKQCMEEVERRKKTEDELRKLKQIVEKTEEEARKMEMALKQFRGWMSGAGGVQQSVWEIHQCRAVDDRAFTERGSNMGREEEKTQEHEEAVSECESEDEETQTEDRWDEGYQEGWQEGWRARDAQEPTRNNSTTATRSQPAFMRTREGPYSKYTDDMRLTIMGLMKSGVSGEKASWIVEWVAKTLFHTILSHTPSPKACSGFATECAVAAKQQIAEFVSKEEKLTLGHDETTKNQQKVQTYMLYGANGARATMGVFHVSDKSAKTSLDTFLWSLQRILHYGYSIKPSIRIECPEVLKKINCTISDQASTEKSFNNMLEKVRQSIPGMEKEPLNRFYCVMHLIAGWASDAQEGLEKVELAYNQTASAFNFIYTVVKCFQTTGNNYEHALGKLFQDCCEDEFTKSMVQQLDKVVGSRATSCYKNAYPLLLALPGLRKFLKDLANTKTLNLMEQAILTATENEVIINQLVCMSIVWFRLMLPAHMVTKKGDLKKANGVEFGPFTRNVLQSLQVWVSNPAGMMNGEARVEFDTLQATAMSEAKWEQKEKALLELQNRQNEKQLAILEKMLQRVVKVHTRRGADFLEGGRWFSPTAEDKAAAANVPSNSDHLEGQLGDYDYTLRGAPNMSIRQASDLCTIKAMKTAEHLAEMKEGERKDVMEACRRLAPQYRIEMKEWDKKVQEARKRQYEEGQRKGKEKEKKKQKQLEESQATQVVKTVEELESKIAELGGETNRGRQNGKVRDFLKNQLRVFMRLADKKEVAKEKGVVVRFSAGEKAIGNGALKEMLCRLIT